MKSTEIRQAFEWTCDNCGIDQFERAILAETDAETLAAMREEHGIQPWEQGNYLMAPAKVTCKQCGETFGTFED